MTGSTSAVLISALTLSAALGSELPEKLKTAPANTPVVLLEEGTGGRLSPGFFWSPQLKRFVLFAGYQNGKKPHYDVEHFDLGAARWTNAYPEGAPYKTESGPTDAPGHGAARDGTFALVDAKGVSRVPLHGGYFGSTAVLIHHQYTLDPLSGTLYALIHNRLTTLDTNTGTWAFADSAERKSKSNLKNHSAWGMSGFEGPGCFMRREVINWGSLSRDPVNREIICVGGNAMAKGGTPGTWAWSIEKKSWRKLEFGTPELKTLRGKIVELRDRSWALLSHARSRFFLTESPEEARTRLSEPCAKLRSDLAALAAELDAAELPKIFDAGRKLASARISRYASALGEIETKLDTKADADFLLGFRDAHRLLESAVFGLDDQPSGRAHSKTVLDPVSRKIVLFGGEGMDRSLSDTWVYDCASRSWEQKYPDSSPPPSAAHVLAWLPRAKRVVMVGGYNKTGYRPFQIWTYRTAANKWSLHKSVKPGKGYYGRASWKSLNVPTGYRNLATVGAVDDHDAMVLVQNRRDKRVTWALKIDAGGVLAGPQSEAGSMVFSQEGPAYHVFRDSNFSRHKGPAFYEKRAAIQPDKMKAFLEGLPVNTWVALPKPPVNAPHRDYGTTRYDPVRKQFLLWGGGHVNYFGTEVNHYSLRAGSWTAGEVPDEPLEPCFTMCMKVGMSFRHRPHITSHAYQYYDYDYTTGLMLVAKYGKTYAYDVSARRWLWPLIEGGAGGIRATPKGAIGARDGSLVRFDREGWKWVEFPCKSRQKPPGVRIDYSGFCYDRKRDDVWYFNKKGVYRFDLQAGEVKHVSPRIAVKGYLREMLYIPELDRIMFHNRNAPDHDRHSFWNPEKLAWETASIPLVGSDGKTKPAKPVRFSTAQGLMRDHLSGMIYVGGAGRTNYALKLEPDKLAFTTAEEESQPMRRNGIPTLLLAAAFLCGAASAAEEGQPAPPKVLPELEPDPALLKKIADLPENTWLKLPKMKVTGDLDWVDAFNWKSMRQRGPYGRDYSCKAAWMPDRKRAIYAGGGHNIRPYNDVWEYDLAANTWVCLYGADAPAQRRPPEWVGKNLLLEGGVLKTRRGGPPRLSHTFDGWNYDSGRRVAFMPESLRGAVFVDAPTVAQGLGLTGDELTTRWKPGPYLLTFDPYARKWGYVTENVPRCGRDPSARYVPHLKSWWVSSGGRVGLYDPAAGTSRKLSFANGGGGYGSSTVYDPDTRSIVVITPGGKKNPAATWVYSLDGDAWKKTQSPAPAGGCSSSGYFDYDTTAKRCLLYSRRCRPNFWTYDVKSNCWTPAEFEGQEPGGSYVIGYYDPARDVLVHYDSRDVWVCRLRGKKK